MKKALIHIIVVVFFGYTISTMGFNITTWQYWVSLLSINFAYINGVLTDNW